MAWRVDTDYHQRDLYEHIGAGDFPSWTLKMQIMPFQRRRGLPVSTRST